MKKDVTSILMTIPNFKTAGSQYVVRALLKGIPQEVFRVFVLVEKHPNEFPNDIPEENRLYIDGNLPLKAYVKAFMSCIKKNEIKLVHSWDYKSTSREAIACKLARVPYVYTKKNNAWSKRWKVKSMLANHIAYNNPDMESRFFSSLLFRKKTTFVPHGLENSFFNKRKEVASRANEFHIGCIGVLGPNKNQMFILEALNVLPEHFKVSFYGRADETYLEQLKAYCNKYQLSHRVKFCGYLENTKIPEVMAQFHCLVLASKQEGLPLCILEAMANQVPVLASNSGGGARYLLHDNAGGYIFNLPDQETLVELLNTLAAMTEEDYLALGEKGFQRAKQHFTLEKEIETYMLLYKKLIG